MNRRKSQPPKRTTTTTITPPEETIFSAEVYRNRLSKLPRYDNLTYPTFVTFFARLAIQYTYGSSKTIEELERLFEREKNVQGGPVTREDFAHIICNWTLYYKSEMERFQKEIIAVINAGAALSNLGLEVRPSTIQGAGNGLFTTRSWRAGQRLTGYGGYYCSVDAFELLDSKDSREYVLAIPLSHGGGIRDAQVGFRLCDMGRWSNSISNNLQNTFTRVTPGSMPPELEFVAARDLQVGEEILWDYGDKMRFLATTMMECSICTQLETLHMCSKCEKPICGNVCQKMHAKESH